uniref:Uncharacterized protein n=1 Tax=Anopheles epiroticus TaxID=199890 RepID=A0A182P586_9DIPT
MLLAVGLLLSLIRAPKGSSEMISVKLFNQYHARTFDVPGQLDANEQDLDADRPLPAGHEDIDAVNRLDGIGNDLAIEYVHPPTAIEPIDVIDRKENGIEQDLVVSVPMPDQRLLDGWMQPRTPESNAMPADGAKPNAVTTTTTTTSTTTRTTTVRKIHRKARLMPRSIRQEEAAPAPCGCQHKKRSLGNHLYSSEEMGDPAGDYDEYDDYDYGAGELRLPPVVTSRPMLLPAMSRLLATPVSGEALESSVERAEKVHGTLERLMGIVTIFSHVDEFIQRKTKQSIRRLARLYESEELY